MYKHAPLEYVYTLYFTQCVDQLIPVWYITCFVITVFIVDDLSQIQAL